MSLSSKKLDSIGSCTLSSELMNRTIRPFCRLWWRQDCYGMAPRRSLCSINSSWGDKLALFWFERLNSSKFTRKDLIIYFRLITPQLVQKLISAYLNKWFYTDHFSLRNQLTASSKFFSMNPMVSNSAYGAISQYRSSSQPCWVILNDSLGIKSTKSWLVCSSKSIILSRLLLT